MEQVSCEFIISLLGCTAGTLFWLLYLTWEMEHYKGKRTNRWWERDITSFFRRGQ